MTKLMTVVDVRCVSCRVSQALHYRWLVLSFEDFKDVIACTGNGQLAVALTAKLYVCVVAVTVTLPNC